MIKHYVFNRFTGAVQFAAEIDCADDASVGVKLGLAVKWAVKARANLAGADLAGADLARSNLAGANLVGASLAHSDLTRSNLADANLAGASLAHSDLARSNLARSNLADANLAGASLAHSDLTRSNLARANLVDANLADANLAGAYLVIDAGSPNGWRCVGWLRDGWLSVRVGCHDRRLREGREYWAGKRYHREVLAALDYVEAIAKLRGWALGPVKKEAA